MNRDIVLKVRFTRSEAAQIRAVAKALQERNLSEFLRRAIRFGMRELVDVYKPDPKVK